MAYERYEIPRPISLSQNITLGDYPMRGGAPLPFERYAVGVREPTMGALGLAPVASAVVSKGAGMAAAPAAAGVATYVGSGAAAGPIGAAVGLIVGIVATKLLTKNYLNVGAMNADEANQIATFTQYLALQGQAPGRQYGLATMVYIWKGALKSGHFPKNQSIQCFHNGCSAHGGDTDLIDNVISGANCSDPNCFPNVLPAFLPSRSSSTSGALTTPGMARTQVIPRAALALSRGTQLFGLGPAGGSFRGFGALGQAGSPLPDAVVFIDQFFIPANSPGSPCRGGSPECYWAAPSSNIEHQLLYDVADAYLAQQPITTTPHLAAQPYPPPPAAQARPAV